MDLCFSFTQAKNVCRPHSCVFKTPWLGCEIAVSDKNSTTCLTKAILPEYERRDGSLPEPFSWQQPFKIQHFFYILTKRQADLESLALFECRESRHTHGWKHGGLLLVTSLILPNKAKHCVHLARHCWRHLCFRICNLVDFSFTCSNWYCLIICLKPCFSVILTALCSAFGVTKGTSNHR